MRLDSKHTRVATTHTVAIGSQCSQLAGSQPREHMYCTCTANTSTVTITSYTLKQLAILGSSMLSMQLAVIMVLFLETLTVITFPQPPFPRTLSRSKHSGPIDSFGRQSKLLSAAKHRERNTLFRNTNSDCFCHLQYSCNTFGDFVQYVLCIVFQTVRGLVWEE